MVHIYSVPDLADSISYKFLKKFKNELILIQGGVCFCVARLYLGVHALILRGGLIPKGWVYA